jgi:hypothetical protein
MGLLLEWERARTFGKPANALSACGSDIERGTHWTKGGIAGGCIWYLEVPIIVTWLPYLVWLRAAIGPRTFPGRRFPGCA